MFKINFVLAAASFVSRAFNFKAHVFQGQTNFTTGIFTPIIGGQIKITGLIGGNRGRIAIFVLFKKGKTRIRR